MSLQRKINKRAAQKVPDAFNYSNSMHRAITQGCPPEAVNKRDKGMRDGSCNRTACQKPLEGMPRWSMPNYTRGGRLYYCTQCVNEFHKWDRRCGDELRCTIIPEDRRPEDEAPGGGIHDDRCGVNRGRECNCPSAAFNHLLPAEG